MNYSSRSARRRRFAERQQQERSHPEEMPPVSPSHKTSGKPLSRKSRMQPRRLESRAEVRPGLALRPAPERSAAPIRSAARRRQPQPRSDRFSLRSLFGLTANAVKPVPRRLPPQNLQADRPSPLKIAARGSVAARSRIETTRFDQRTGRPDRPTEVRSRRRRSPARLYPTRRPASPLLHVARLVILGVGIGSIAGTLLSLNPAMRQGEVAQAVRSSEVQQSVGGQPIAASSVSAIGQGQEITALKTTIQALTAGVSGLTPGVFLTDVDTGAYLDLNGSSTFSAASMIKVPVLVALLQSVDAGKIRLDESLTLKSTDVASGSGEMQYQPIGTRYSILETAFRMITVSDNTATNMLIARLGGADALNQQFRQWGLTSTALHHPLPDLEGTNTTTPKELTELLSKVNQGELLSIRSRDRMFDIMRHTETNTLLPAGLAPNATIAHKTGDIGSMVGDTGVIDLPNGKRYVMTVMVQRPHNDDRAQELIRQISRATYEYLSQPQSADATQTLGNQTLSNQTLGNSRGTTGETPSDGSNSQTVPASSGQ